MAFSNATVFGSARSVYRTLAIPLLGIVAWCILTLPRHPFVDPLILPAPMSVAMALGNVLKGERGLADLFATTQRLFATLLVATGVGVPLGLLFGTQRKLFAYVEVPLNALRSVPAAALFPLFLIVIGVGERSIVALASYNATTVMVIYTVAGAFLASQSRVDQARVLGLGRWRLATKVLYWEALPHITSGLRVATGYALALIVAVEMFIGTSNKGLGRRIFEFQASYRIPETYASILLAALLGVVVNYLLNLAERRLLRWLPQAHAKG